MNAELQHQEAASRANPWQGDCFRPEAGSRYSIVDNRHSAIQARELKKVIQRVSFDEFLQNMQKKEASEDLLLYTHVLDDGMGDIGMLQNLAGILDTQRGPLKINQIIKCGTVYDQNSTYRGQEPTEAIKGIRKRKVDKMKGMGFQVEEVYSKDSGTPAIGTRSGISPEVGKNWEIQSPVPDCLSVIDHMEDENFTVITEMGVECGTSTTMARKEGVQEVGIIAPKQEKVRYEGNIPPELLQWLRITEENFRNPTYDLPKIAIINVRRFDKSMENFRPLLCEIRERFEALGYQRTIILGNSILESCNGFCCEAYFTAPSLDPVLLKHLIQKLPGDGLVVAGGEGLFSEALGLGKSDVMLGARYTYQYEALIHKAQEKGFDIWPVIKASMKLVGMGVEEFPERHRAELTAADSAKAGTGVIKSLTDALRTNDINAFISTHIMLK